MKTRYVVQVWLGNWTDWRICRTLKAARVNMIKGGESLHDFRIIKRTDEVVE